MVGAWEARAHAALRWAARALLAGARALLVAVCWVLQVRTLPCPATQPQLLFDGVLRGDARPRSHDAVRAGRCLCSLSCCRTVRLRRLDVSVQTV